MKLVFVLLAILAYAVATPASIVTRSRRFRLKSRVLTTSSPSFDNLFLEPYHIYPPFNYAVLSLKTTRNPGVIGYLNGTSTEIKAEEADHLFDFGSNEPPYGFVINQVNATYDPIEINAGDGTQGIFIDQGIIKYHNPISGGFYGQSIPIDEVGEANED